MNRIGPLDVCWWCKCRVFRRRVRIVAKEQDDDATRDHIYGVHHPARRNDPRYVIACRRCNTRRAGYQGLPHRDNPDPNGAVVPPDTFGPTWISGEVQSREPKFAPPLKDNPRKQQWEYTQGSGIAPWNEGRRGGWS